jgi:hypothetical protein
MQYNIDSLKVIHTQIEGSEIESNPRIHLVFGYVVVALEHQDAIARLVELIVGFGSCAFATSGRDGLSRFVGQPYFK